MTERMTELQSAKPDTVERAWEVIAELDRELMAAYEAELAAKAETRRAREAEARLEKERDEARAELARLHLTCCEEDDCEETAASIADNQAPLWCNLCHHFRMNALRARVERLTEVLEEFEGLHAFCPECGPLTGVDEDGLCPTCGATSMGAAVDVLRVRVSAALRNNQETRLEQKKPLLQR